MTFNPWLIAFELIKDKVGAMIVVLKKTKLISNIYYQ